ncbi:hypothetical protein [Idiomarina xiamenensis]|uniref:PilZ domain-containing protein n=1 Tax=Idiomarina xiamenensis 10-D-4 TaxID=740709 RepID=K2K8R6_9GAMM|nr:hypothetical protein [Idiomarina xiamenensis]EKE82957.1 hypothetical protein A10D4_08959 [Idiomarina xiamenensis 10-D-4]
MKQTSEQSNQAPIDEQQLREQFDEYFMVQQPFTVTLEPVNAAQVPAPHAFIDDIPEVFILASDMQQGDQATLSRLRYENERLAPLFDIVQQQSQRLNIMLGYLLRHQQDAAQQYQGIAFGAGGIRVHSDKPLQVGATFRCKLFIQEDAIALYSYVYVLDSQSADEAGLSQTALAFVRIREDDQELIIRASLHSQSRQLKQRAEQKRLQQSDAVVDDKHTEQPLNNEE